MTRFICAAVLGAVAVQSLAASVHHQHQHHHAEKREPVDFNNPDLYKDVDWAAIFGDKEAAPAPAAPAKAASAPAAAAPASSSSSSDDTDSSASESGNSAGFGGITSAIANGNVDQYIGNVGIPYGSNIIKVPASKADSFDYTNLFKNEGSSPANVIVWNKSGPDGQANSGQFLEPTLSFTLAPGASQYVAFDKNSQVAFCNSSGKKTAYGANDCTFGEADFGNESNGGWSGYDVSSIQNTAGNNSPLQISSPNGATSSNTGNNYVSDTQAGGIGGNLAPGNVRLTTTFS